MNKKTPTLKELKAQATLVGGLTGRLMLAIIRQVEEMKRSQRKLFETI